MSACKGGGSINGKDKEKVNETCVRSIYKWMKIELNIIKNEKLRKKKERRKERYEKEDDQKMKKKWKRKKI